MTKPVRDADLPLDAVLSELPADVQQELAARFEDRLALKLARYPDAAPDALRSIVQQEHKNYVVKRRVPCYDPKHPGPCRAPNQCVEPGHASDGLWAERPYAKDWVTELLAAKVGDGVWRRITLSTGPGPGDDSESLEDMVEAACQFSRTERFRWDEFFCRTNPRLKTDNRIITAPRRKFLLEARVRLVPVDARHSSMVSRITSNHITMACVGWRVQYEFLYFGPDLSDAQVERLTRRWVKHKRNRGRNAACQVRRVKHAGGALSEIQGYRLDCLDLPGIERVRLDRIRADSRLRRIFRLGVGQGKLKQAKAWWKEALADATCEAYCDPMPWKAWSQQLAKLDHVTAWDDAMRRIELDDDRTEAHKWRWSRRRELYKQQLRDVMAVSIRPSAFTRTSPHIDPKAGGAIVPLIKEEATMTREELRETMRQAAEEGAYRGTSRALAEFEAGRIDREEFDRRVRAIGDGLEARASRKVQ